MKKYEQIRQKAINFSNQRIEQLNAEVAALSSAEKFHKDDGIAGGLNSRDAGISDAHFTVFGGLYAKINGNHLPEFLLWLQDMLTEVPETNEKETL